MVPHCQKQENGHRGAPSCLLRHFQSCACQPRGLQPPGTAAATDCLCDVYAISHQRHATSRPCLPLAYSGCCTRREGGALPAPTAPTVTASGMCRCPPGTCPMHTQTPECPAHDWPSHGTLSRRRVRQRRVQARFQQAHAAHRQEVRQHPRRPQPAHSSLFTACCLPQSSSRYGAFPEVGFPRSERDLGHTVSCKQPWLHCGRGGLAVSCYPMLVRGLTAALGRMTTTSAAPKLSRGKSSQPRCDAAADDDASSLCLLDLRRETYHNNFSEKEK